MQADTDDRNEVFPLFRGYRFLLGLSRFGRMAEKCLFPLIFPLTFQMSFGKLFRLNDGSMQSHTQGVADTRLYRSSPLQECETVYGNTRYR